MTVAGIGDILATEFGKIADDIVIYCIAFTIILIVAGIVIRLVKNFLRKIFKK